MFISDNKRKLYTYRSIDVASLKRLRFDISFRLWRKFDLFNFSFWCNVMCFVQILSFPVLFIPVLYLRSVILFYEHISSLDYRPIITTNTCMPSETIVYGTIYEIQTYALVLDFRNAIQETSGAFC